MIRHYLLVFTAATGCFLATDSTAATPDIGELAIRPRAATAGASLTLSAVVEIQGRRVRKAILERSDGANGFRRVGRLHDDGEKGDVAAGDGFFTLITKPIGFRKVGNLSFRVVATFRDRRGRRRVASKPRAFEITPAGIPNDLSPSDLSKAISDPQLGTVVCDEVLVILEEGVAAVEAVTRLEGIGQVVGRIPQLNLYQVRLSGDCTQEALATGLRRASEVSGAIRSLANSILPSNSIAESPDDSAYPVQFYLSMVHADTVWREFTIGDSRMIVAVVDTGVDYGNFDLGLFRSGGRIIKGGTATDAGIDDNGDPVDTRGHGTRVAGVLGALTDNGTGVAGVSWLNPVLAIRAYQTTAALYWGIISAVDRGAKVINVSQGGPAGILSEGANRLGLNDYGPAVGYAAERGRLVVASAGNEGVSYRPNAPAAVPEALAVGALESLDVVAEYSNYGSWVDLYAPGSEIVVLKFGGTRDACCEVAWGTSFAAPIVSGAAALLWSLGPTVPAAVIRDKLVTYASSGGATDRDGYPIRRLDIFSAISLTVPRARFTIESQGLAASQGEALTLRVSRFPVEVTVTDKSFDPDGHIVDRSWSLDGRPVRDATASGFTRPLPTGTHAIGLSVVDNDGFMSNAMGTVNITRGTTSTSSTSSTTSTTARTTSTTSRSTTTTSTTARATTSTTGATTSTTRNTTTTTGATATSTTSPSSSTTTTVGATTTTTLSSCGNHNCDQGEDCASCAMDCGACIPARAYVASRSDNTLAVIDTATRTVLNIIPGISNTCARPYGVAVHADGSKVYVANDYPGGCPAEASNLSVIDARAGTVTTNIPIGGVLRAVAVDPTGTDVYAASFQASNHPGVLSVISAATNTVKATVQVGQAPWDVVSDPAQARVYVLNFADHSISVIDTTSYAVTTTIALGNRLASAMAIHPLGRWIYVANEQYPDSVSTSCRGLGLVTPFASVAVVDTTTNEITRPMCVRPQIQALAINPTGTRLYAPSANGYSCQWDVMICDIGSNTCTEGHCVDPFSGGVAVTPDGSSIYVVGRPDVSVLNAVTNEIVATIPIGPYPYAFGQFIGPVPADP